MQLHDEFESSFTVKQGQHGRSWTNFSSHAVVFRGDIYAEESNDSLKFLKTTASKIYTSSQAEKMTGLKFDNIKM